jgi:hypothetical protein
MNERSFGANVMPMSKSLELEKRLKYLFLDLQGRQIIDDILKISTGSVYDL